MKLLNKWGLYTDRDFQNYKKTFEAQKRNIELYQLQREIAEIQNWRDALDYAEDIDAPDRTELIRLYNEVLLDDGVDEFVDSLTYRILAAEFDVIDQEGNIQEDKQANFDGEWFDDIVESFVKAQLKGHRLIEILPKNGKIDRLEDIFIFPDQYVIPQWRRIMKQEGSVENTIEYNPADLNIIEMGNPRKHGMLNSIIPLYIYKKNALQFWSNYQKKFGVPPVVAKTNLNDEGSRNNMYTFLKQLTNNSVGVIDNNDEIAGLNVNSTDGYNTFNEMRKAMNEDIQRRLEGQTMTAQEGSSRAQAEVHERTGDLWFYGRLNKFKRLINTQIIPLLANSGFQINDTDRIRYKENKDIEALVTHITKLKQSGYNIDPEWIEENTGYPVEEVEQQAQPGSAMGELENLYNSL